jgi:hypothetical protein
VNKKLIEVALPLDGINKASEQEGPIYDSRKGDSC